MEEFFPLHAYVCNDCWLVQLKEYIRPENIFSEYAYFSSYSDSWLKHARDYCLQMIENLGLNQEHLVVEIASNDGYLLKNFVEQGIPCLGIEPAANVAKVATQRNVPSICKFFGSETARELVADGMRPDLLLGNNVLAHVPDLNDFVAGLQILLADDGVITMEFPHLVRLMEQRQFDTIYHEHFSYLSLVSVQRVFAAHGLKLFDVEELVTHGGSVRIYACHAENGRQASQRLIELCRQERELGLEKAETYDQFASDVAQLKREILRFFIEAKDAGKTVAGYGAPGKGITLLNYCGIRSDFMSFTVDRNQYKQGNYMPGTGIKVHAPEYLHEQKPDYVFILPWNLKNEIMHQMQDVHTWGGKFVIPIPNIEII